MKRGRVCVERNRSERAKVANVAEWKPPTTSFAPLGYPRRKCQEARARKHGLWISVITAMMTAGTATILFALLRRREAAPATPYDRPEGGEREGEFELFIGS